MDGFQLRLERRKAPPVTSRRGLIGTYQDAHARWVDAGQPVRTDAEVSRIFDEICKPCEHFIAQPLGTGRCRLCGCQLNLTKKFAKIKWATESCPDNPPRWTSELEEQVQQEAPQKQESRKTRRERRIRERAERATGQKADKRQDARAAPEIVKPAVSTDELVLYDRTGREIGHVLRDSWSNWHSSPAAFLVGSGPSLNELDLEPLKDRGVMSLGINNVAAWAPCRAMIMSDPPEKFHTGIWLDAAITKFVAKEKLDKRIRIRDRDTGNLVFSTLNAGHCPSVFGYRKDAVWRVDDFLTAQAATVGSGKGCPRWQATGLPETKVIFTFFAALRLLHYLGIRTVYLLGVDFAMMPGNAYAFPQDVKTTKWVPGNNRYYRLASEMLEELRPVFQRAKFNVYQCNPHSHLRVFDYISYKTAVAHCRSMVGGLLTGDPKDLADWYIKAGENFDERD